jgi:hypothetical protein
MNFKLHLNVAVSALSQIGLGALLIMATIDNSWQATVLLYFFVVMMGLYFCRLNFNEQKFNNISVLQNIWILKVSVSMFLLYVGWIPELSDFNSKNWGYDPQRYYHQAQELIDNDWLPDFTSLNYVGILYYYAILYKLIGFNPVVPLLVNSFFTLTAVLRLMKFTCDMKIFEGSQIWRVALIMLLPELIWYDLITSRETLIAALLLYAEIEAADYIINPSDNKRARLFLTLFVAIALIAAVRTSMILSPMLSIILTQLFLAQSKQNNNRKIFVYLLLFICFVMGSTYVSDIIGGYEFNLYDLISNAVNSEENLASSLDGWSSSSLGKMLLPNNIFQAILFLLPRAIMYMVSPLPNIQIDIDGLMTGSWVAWQSLITVASSCLNIMALPYVFASIYFSVKAEKPNKAILAINIALLSNILAIAGGNLIIHERYRVMSASLFYCAALIGYCKAKGSVMNLINFRYYTLALISGVMYFIFKI